MTELKCTVPPAGWTCTRKAGHDGPCAAIATLHPLDAAARREVIGFTGTRHGMTRYQRHKLADMLAARKPAEFHHGDCIGADAQAHALVRELLPDCTIMIHPPGDPSLRAWCKADGEYDPAPYLVRNERIVDTTFEVLAAPYERQMQRRGGTWSTVRYALRRKKPCLVITPAGNVEAPHA